MTPRQKALRREQLKRERSRRRARDGLIPFAQTVCPGYKPNWHHLVLADKLERWARGEIKRLIVTMPPRHGKTELTSKILPAWLLGQNPRNKVMVCSYGASLAEGCSRQARQYSHHPQYDKVFPAVYDGPQARSSLKSTDAYWETAWGGYVLSAGVGGPITGKGFTKGIIDDPVKDWVEAMSKGVLERAWDWYKGTFYTRRAPGAGILLNMTRWSKSDLAGHILESMEDRTSEHWEILHFEALKDEVDHPEDPREKGEALWEDRFPVPFFSQLRKTPHIWKGNYQGDPVGKGGNLWQKTWFTGQYYQQEELPETFDEWILCSDLAFYGTATSSRVCFQVWARKGANRYLMDEVCEHLTFLESIDALLGLLKLWPQLSEAAIVIEDKANGPALMNTLSTKVPGLQPFTPLGSKPARAMACLPLYSAGNIWLPHPESFIQGTRSAVWVRLHVDELVDFPSGGHKDRVDTASMAHRWFSAHSMTIYIAGGGLPLVEEVEKTKPMQREVKTRTLQWGSVF